MNASGISTRHHPSGATYDDPAHDSPELRPLLLFLGVALPVGWALLSIPLVVDLALPE